jgi:hypothetical protein
LRRRRLAHKIASKEGAAVPVPVWDRPFFKYVVRESFNRADTIASTAGTIILLIAAHFVVGGGKMLSADEFVRSIQIALAGFVSIWLAIMLFRACWWPFHWRLEPHGGLLSFLRTELGTFMWPVVLITSGLAAFIVLSGSGMIWLSLQLLNSAPTEKSNSPNTVGNPDFSLSVPVERYRFTWPSVRLMQFYLRLDTERNPQLFNNPAFVLRNKTNTIAYRVAATWKSETTINIQDTVQASPKLSKADIRVSDVEINVIWTDKMPRQALGNYTYYLADAPKQVIPVISKEEEVYLPMQLWPVVAIYLVDKMPDGIGKTSPPFIARVTLEWETSEGKRQKPYRVGITATNAKSSNSDDPIVDAYLNFTLEEIPH